MSEDENPWIPRVARMGTNITRIDRIEIPKLDQLEKRVAALEKAVSEWFIPPSRELEASNRAFRDMLRRTGRNDLLPPEELSRLDEWRYFCRILAGAMAPVPADPLGMGDDAGG